MPELNIIGNPINTRIGILYPSLVKEYPILAQYYNILILDKSMIDARLDSIATPESVPIITALKDLNLFEFLHVYSNPGSDFYDLYIQYRELFGLCFREDVFGLIESDDELSDYIEVIKEVNNIQIEKPNPNPEIERRNQLRAKLQSMKGESISFEGMFTSVEAVTGRDPNEMTMYRFHKLFERICQIKNYDTTTMYAMMSDKVDVQPWYKDIEVTDDESYITEEQLNNAKENHGLQEDL